MAQMITLEEAASRLGITPEEMKKRLKTDPEFKKLSQVRDGSNVRFKAAAIDELARLLGMASEDALAMAPLDAPGSDDFKVPGLDDKKKPKKPDDDLPLDFGTSEEEVFSLADDSKANPPKASGKSSGKLMPPKPPKSSPRMSDSSTGSDSDVRLDGGKKSKRPDEAAVPTEEIALDFSGPGSAVIKGGSSAKLSAPKTGGSSGKLDVSKGNKGNKPADNNDSSEFELSLDADSDDFDLQMNPDAGDEVDLGSMPKEKGAAPRGSASGINLSAPADSGISLEKSKTGKKDDAGKSKAAKPTDDSDGSDVDFELSLDSSAVASNTKLGAPKSGKLVLDSDSDSEFELTLDDSGGSLEQAALGADGLGEGEDKGDIFETDFEIPQMPDESASEAVALESDTDLEKSDFELAMDDSDVATDDSASEVVLLDEDEDGPKAKKKPVAKAKKKALVSDDEVDLSDDAVTDENDASVSKALKGAKGKKRDEDGDEEAVPAGAGATASWGVLPALFLAPALVFTLMGAIMGYELLQTMWGYQQPRKPTAPLVRGLASQFDMELKDQ